MERKDFKEFFQIIALRKLAGFHVKILCIRENLKITFLMVKAYIFIWTGQHIRVIFRMEKCMVKEHYISQRKNITQVIL
jgi:hypothetical protein